MKFRQARWSAQVNVSEAARRAGVNRSTVHDIERGKYNSVRPETALKLSRAIGVDPAGVDEFKSVVAEVEAVKAE